MEPTIPVQNQKLDRPWPIEFERELTATLNRQMDKLQRASVQMCYEWIVLHYPHCEMMADSMKKAMFRMLDIAVDNEREQKNAKEKD